MMGFGMDSGMDAATRTWFSRALDKSGSAESPAHAFLLLLVCVPVLWYTLSNIAAGNDLRFAMPPGLAMLLVTVLILAFAYVNAIDMPAMARLRLQVPALLGLLLIVSNSIILILTIILMTNLPKVLSVRRCIAVAIALPLAYVAVTEIEYGWINAVLYSAYNLFSLRLSWANLKEQEASATNRRLLRELQATQTLLAETAKRDERLRIARDLHDMMGHRLTALNLQLELMRQLGGQPQPAQLEKAKGLAEDLMADVRRAVSDIRSLSGINLSQSLRALIDDIDKPRVVLAIDERVHCDNTAVAELLLRATQEAMTNIRRHSDASECRIEIWRDDTSLYWQAADNGSMLRAITPGNGLKGMRERAQALDGTLDIACGLGLTLTISLPLPLIEQA
ncbi:sensor histidine kinase [Shewanella sp. JM162201]|uniref:Sensor histidine kinase n=1 Tax=Shewanella jiangmenensis TaxID=2837387 RepID=A0ABS5V8K1_9GAMM|nr:sensor histidine kinase [Shewanella jiangmenensis]MBT1446177.1 sensor histidine kinase [Shewanella jiangmenensis]